MTTFDHLTWTCHVCGDERPDAFISVHKKKTKLNVMVVGQNIRYCNDRSACISGAPDIDHLKERK